MLPATKFRVEIQKVKFIFHIPQNKELDSIKCYQAFSFSEFNTK